MRLTASLVISLAIIVSQQSGTAGLYPSFSWFEAFKHEKAPHRHEIRVDGVTGFEILHMKLVIAPDGSVVEARPIGRKRKEQIWPEVQSEVLKWKFVPFEKNGRPVTAKVEEQINLLPLERVPTFHISPPDLQSDSKVAITLSRNSCLGTCPAYRVIVTTHGTEFDGFFYVSAVGKHVGTVNPDAVRKLARDFINADFYSMEDSYEAQVTDMPSYTLTLDIDGHVKTVKDYAGSWVGMPSVISEFEKNVDELAQTQQWIKGPTNSPHGN